MSILSDHFERVRQHEAQGLPLTRGVFYDVGWTLIRRTINQPLIDFAVWNRQHKLLGDNHVFSADVDHSEELISDAGLDLSQLGVAEITPKGWAYNAAFNGQHKFNLEIANALSIEERKAFIGRPAYCLELVIDDRPLEKPGIKGASMVLTHWSPDDHEVQEFLQRKDYLKLTP